MIREAVVAGQFYPSRSSDLDSFFSSALKFSEKTSDAVAIVVPHAGYIYSGKIAGRAYSEVSFCSALIIQEEGPLFPFSKRVHGKPPTVKSRSMRNSQSFCFPKHLWQNQISAPISMNILLRYRSPSFSTSRKPVSGSFP